MGLTKNQYRGGDCLKRGLGQFVNLRGGGAWQERGGLIPQCTLEFPSGSKAIVEQILASEERNKSKRAGL